MADSDDYNTTSLFWPISAFSLPLQLPAKPADASSAGTKCTYEELVSEMTNHFRYLFEAKIFHPTRQELVSCGRALAQECLDLGQSFGNARLFFYTSG